ncbi:ankyrin repeat protein [Oesophagostomum dentatum]|uniref:Ankyrin repeat protein n=1 Tax=Oesophagostomum dentatum TaxID=61180 RepID=A0A0B1TKX0_OESDE|nr:ankyrin repeat protein [Oesophagostomum dentatum]
MITVEEGLNGSTGDPCGVHTKPEERGHDGVPDKTNGGGDTECSNEEEVQTPPPSPTIERNNSRPSCESIRVVHIRVVFPAHDHRSLLRVVQGSFKNKPAEPLHHVVFLLSDSPNSPAYSLFRSTDVEDAVDLCRRCLECYILFRLLDRSKEPKKAIHDLMAKLKQYPLYRMIHIAIACDRLDLFSDANLEYLNRMNTPFQSLMKMMVQPEGKYPLLLAIEMHRLKIVRRMLTMGADPLVKDINGNNAIHYASLASVQMLELLWEFEGCHVLLNQTNNEGYVPLMLAIRAANPRCFATLLNFGAELSMRVQGRNPLFEAMQSKGKNTDIIKAIIEASPDLVAERDSSGNTALHVAMYKTPLMGLLLLKCKDVDLNAKNNAGQTPLHIFTHKVFLQCFAEAAESRKFTRSILDSLLKCGARSCGPKKMGCVSGCVNEAMVGLLKSSASSMDSESPRSSSTALSSQDYPESVEVDHPIRDFTQKLFYEELIARLESMEAYNEKPAKMVNLLSMDGGGIRGLVILQGTVRSWPNDNKRDHDYFIYGIPTRKNR